MADFAESIRPTGNTPVKLASIAELVQVSLASGSDVAVSGVSASSGEVRPGDIFFGMPGASTHGAKFADSAVESGAVALITDQAGAQLVRNTQVPVLVVEHPRDVLGRVAARVYGTDRTAPQLFGITGTNGKTTSVYFLAALLTQLGNRVGLSSTSERVIDGVAHPAGLTTPEAHQMHALVAAMVEHNVTKAVLEVSAHAITRHRVDALAFDVVGFTQFSQDHLDDYGTMENYFQTKQSFFTPAHASRGVVVLDSQWCVQLFHNAQIPVTSVGMVAELSPQWLVRITKREADNTSFELSGPDGLKLNSSVALVGDHSAVNAALAIVMAAESGIPFAEIASVLDRDGGLRVHIPGRTELVSSKNSPQFYVDYGHTPGAFEVTLRELRKVTPGKLIMLFGADGDRDTTKRFAMGEQAARGADVVIVTDYHPRSEDPTAIRAQLLEGARSVSGCDVREEADPARAVRLAVSLAGTSDTIVYAGPGDEDYREIAGEKIEFNAREESRAALREAGWSAS